MKTLHIIICMLLAIGLSAPEAAAFGPETYTNQSVLASGRWVQVAVSATGPHRISARQLAEWGFRDPSKVRIYGSGGAIISDVLSAENYVDDLPQVQSSADASGIVFYAVGPVQTAMNQSGILTHKRNAYTSVGYYYLTDSTDLEARGFDDGGDPADGPTASDQATSLLLHELEQSSPGNSGKLLVGEDFVHTRTRSFDFNTAGRVAGSGVRLTTSFVVAAPTASSISFTAGGSPLAATANDRIPAAYSSETYGAQTTTTKTFVPDSDTDNLRISITFTPGGSVVRANLDYMELNYTRTLSLPGSGAIEFCSSNPSLRISGKNPVVWDVTDPTDIKVMNLSSDGAWRNRYSGQRLYVAFSQSATLPQPSFAANVANQNLHALETPDMVIVTPRAYAEAANRLANFHRNDTYNPLTVEVIMLDNLLHEFGSGTFDPGAIRRCLKMLYDRGQLKFALMMGKGTFDNRAITAVGKAIKAPMPLWISEASLTESSSYSTDDYLAFLEDNSGLRPGTDKLSVALGRIPCTTAAEATLAVEKIEQYRSRMPRSSWRNKVLMLADDGNRGIHMTQSEEFYENMIAADTASSLIYSKVYIDAYEWKNGSFPVARQEFYRNLDDGSMLWIYVGHGSTTALCGDNMVTYLDMSTQFFLRHWPFCYAATCSFLKWDTDIVSAAEMLYFTKEGGVIGAISALRPVYIAMNGGLTAAYGTEFAKRGADGRFRTMGEVYQSAKNARGNDENKLRFVYMGDPALHTVLPSPTIKIDAVNGEAVTPESQVTLKARQQLTITGTIYNEKGEKFTGFNGSISATLYDAEKSVVSFGRGDDGEQVAFDVHGDMLFATGGAVTDGTFSVNVQMPSDVADNFRPATLNLYASSDSTDAIGVCRDLYVFGYDETAPEDVTPPVIHSMKLNHESFSDGDKVNPTPMLIASVSDNSGINLSTAGVGHQTSVTIDGSVTYSNLSGFFTPDPDPVAGAMSGTFAYTLPAMTEGRHSIRLRVWDIAGNYAEETVECNVVSDLAPKIFEVYTDANPASTSASFYVVHNRPDERLTVEVTVYNLLGQPIWSSETSARSDMHTSAPLMWDLTDSAGRRVNRGIYIYRATVSTADGEKHSTASRKIAVTAQ